MARRASPAEVQFVIAEEDGLVTVRLAPEARTALEKKTRSVGVRLRLKPPAKLLREDKHLFDLSVLPALMKLAPLVHGATWTDTIVGVGRVTVSLAVKSAKEAATLQQVLEGIDLSRWKGWKIEEVVIDRSNRDRLHALHGLAAAEAWNRSRDRVAALQRVISREKRPGSLAAHAGLDGPKPTKAKVIKALKWLDGQLAVIEPAVLAALKAKDARELGLYVNMHPRFRQADFGFFSGGEDSGEPLSVEQAAVLEQHFEVTHEQLRRLAGVLWDGKVEAIAGTTRIELVAES